jgi:predicted nucleic acid-binding protein
LIVIDTSVAVKWVINEFGSQDALMLLERGETLLAPDFMLVEAASALRRKVRLREISHDQMIKGLELIDQSVGELISSRQLIARAAALSFELDHSPYDCCFLAAGMSYGFLLTDDAVFVRKCQNAGYGQSVQALSASVEPILSTPSLPPRSDKD